MVVYDPYSGDTHCLDRLASAIMAHLAERGPTTLGALTDDLRPALAGSPPHDAEGSMLAAALGELERLRLVTRKGD